jgi:hypothetical protein
VDVADARDKGDDLDAVRGRQVLLGDGTGGDTACSRAGQRTGELLLAEANGNGVDALMVSRAEDRPPPLLALMPYLARYVQSACDGRG